MSIEMNNRVMKLRQDVDKLIHDFQQLQAIIKDAGNFVVLSERVKKLEDKYTMLVARNAKNDG